MKTLIAEFAPQTPTRAVELKVSREEFLRQIDAEYYAQLRTKAKHQAWTFWKKYLKRLMRPLLESCIYSIEISRSRKAFEACFEQNGWDPERRVIVRRYLTDMISFWNKRIIDGYHQKSGMTAIECIILCLNELRPDFKVDLVPTVIPGDSLSMDEYEIMFDLHIDFNKYRIKNEYEFTPPLTGWPITKEDFLDVAKQYAKNPEEYSLDTVLKTELGV
jgi:hypothetical protein